jgi:hypothetical protein
VDEAGLTWHKSTFSSDTNCVEVAIGDDAVHVRDTKDRAAGALTFTLSEWRAFLAGVRHGEFEPAPGDR